MITGFENTELTKNKKLLEEINKYGIRQKFKVGQVLLREGQYVQFIPLVMRGLIKVYKNDNNGNEILLYYINNGESCIMSHTFSRLNRTSEVKALIEKPSEIILIPVHIAREFNLKYEDWNIFWTKLFKIKYDELLNIIHILSFERKDKRLMDYLLKEQNLRNSNCLEITHQKIANDIGSNREVVSRLLKKMEHGGLLELKHRQIILK